jgi:hypothetical protein
VLHFAAWTLQYARLQSFSLIGLLRDYDSGWLVITIL